MVIKADRVSHGGGRGSTQPRLSMRAVSDNVPVNIVRAVMGHESTSTILNLYTHAPNEYEDRVRGVFDDPDDDSLAE
jgi:hypothetical protein